jgi:signal transduction histidine kinase
MDRAPMNSEEAMLIPGRAKLALAAGFGGLLVILVVLGFYSAKVLSRTRAADSESTRMYLMRREALTDVRNSAYATGSHLRDYLVDPEESRYQSHAESVRKVWEQALQGFLRYQDAAVDRDAVQQVEREMTAYWQIAEQGLQLSGLRRRSFGYRFFAEKVGPSRDTLLTAIEGITQKDDVELRNKISETAIFLDQLALRLWEAIGLSILVGLIVAGLAYRYLIKLESEAATRYQQSREATAQLEQLSHRLLAVQEQERKSLARELHDEVGQSLGALLVDLGQAKSLVMSDPAETTIRINSAYDVGEIALQSIRDISLLLRPSMLDDLGLIPALNWQAREITRRTGMLVLLQSEDDDLDLNEELRTAVYRAVQEALQNSARHSGAKLTEVGIATSDGHLQIMVRDNGRGFEPSHTLGLGLLGMHERVSRLGGKLRIASAPGQGTTLTIELPLGARIGGDTGGGSKKS